MKFFLLLGKQATLENQLIGFLALNIHYKSHSEKPLTGVLSQGLRPLRPMGQPNAYKAKNHIDINQRYLTCDVLVNLPTYVSTTRSNRQIQSLREQCRPSIILQLKQPPPRQLN
jgi:hypothetical protein